MGVRSLAARCLVALVLLILTEGSGADRVGGSRTDHRIARLQDAEHNRIALYGFHLTNRPSLILLSVRGDPSAKQ